MKQKTKQILLIDLILSVILIVVYFTFISYRYDYYYDLNDDMLMKDIVSGIFTGTPNGHNIQMMYPLSAFISLLYTFNRYVPWYGLILWICQAVSLYLIVYRVIKIFETKIIFKVVCIFSFLSIVTVCLLWELIFNQYTVTSSMLAATATFLLYTSNSDTDGKGFLKKNIISIILLYLAFLIRSEMLLLLMPLFLVAVVGKWFNDYNISKIKFFSKAHILKYCSLLGILAASMLTSLMINRIAYSGDSWKEFMNLFNNRTQLYDFQEIPDYYTNSEFYKSIDILESEQNLLVNYNYSLSPKINAIVMGQIASYAKELDRSDLPISFRLQKSISTYFERIRGETDYPYVKITYILYFVLFLFCIFYKDYILFIKILMVFAARSISWFYIVYGQRTPNRITHSLFWMEIVILLAFLLVDGLKRINHNKSKLCLGVTSIFIILLLGYNIKTMPTTIVNADRETVRREEVNNNYLSLLAYCKQNQHNFYYLDVYSSVAYSEKIFKKETNQIRNMDILGGWAAKSPLAKEKMNLFNIDIETLNVEFINNPNLYLIIHEKRDINWMIEYYQESNLNITADKIDEIGKGEGSKFFVYKIHLNGEHND